MATIETFKQISLSEFSSSGSTGENARPRARRSRSKVVLWMALDGITILGAVALAILLKLNIKSGLGRNSIWSEILHQGRSTWTLMAILCGFYASVIIISRRMHLYEPRWFISILHEQRLSVQVCLTSGLLLTGALYLLHAEDIPRGVVLVSLVLITVALSFRRLVHRVVVFRRYQRGIGTRNVLIVGTGTLAQTLRHHLEHVPHLGYAFRGFVDIPEKCPKAFADQTVCAFKDLFTFARKEFVDEIFFATPCEREFIDRVLEESQTCGIDMRVVPDIYQGMAWKVPIEYVGPFPTISLHRRHVPVFGFLVKRVIDILVSCLLLLALIPVFIVIGFAIKLDSDGGAFYVSKRIGKKGQVFGCIKFRTMVCDAEKRREEVMHLNERDGVLFKITKDPRITKLGQFLRKYSLDELPQLFNVLQGDMSLVGPRPPLATEVENYEPRHMRRLEVTPGITGLWQVLARQDPSFDSYISMDLSYIETWSLWLDLKIIVRTIGVVFAGTGT